MSWRDRRERLREILSGSRCIHPALVFDPISARIAEDLGYELGTIGGSMTAMSVLGAPDLGLLTLSELAEQVRRICRATNLPSLVDIDHGYGNALSVMRSVQELETMGAAGLMLEDTLFPAEFGSDSAYQVISLEEGVGKVKAALSARRDPNLVIIARTSALYATGLEDALTRARAYKSAGADAILVVGVKSTQQIDAIVSNLEPPIMLGAMSHDLVDLNRLARQGVRISLQGGQPFSVAIGAVYRALKALQEGVAPEELTGVASAALMKQVTRDKDYQHWSRLFLGAR